MERGTGPVVAAGMGLFFLIVAFAPASHAYRFSVEGDLDLRECPRSVQAAKDLAAKEANHFRKLYSSGTWPGFLHAHRRRIRGCPTYIRHAYIKAARKVLAPDTEPEYTRIRSVKSRKNGL
jgi:hypothetical protein